jgi:hypothetical protein
LAHIFLRRILLFKSKINTDISVLLSVCNSRNFDLSGNLQSGKNPEIIDLLRLRTAIMADLTAKMFRDFFGGSWSAKVTRNGEFQREVVFNWPELGSNNSCFGTEPGLIVPQGAGVLDDTRQVSVSGWRHDVRRWSHVWHNEFGGYGEIQWTSMDVVNGINVLYGYCHECKQECDDPTDHIVMCELLDGSSFRYTIKSYRKGVLEIDATRIRTAKELNALLKNQAGTAKSFSELLML